MKRIVIITIVAVVAGRCFGFTPGSPSSTNLLVAVRATPTPPPKWNDTLTVGVTATAGNVNSVLATSTFTAQKNTPRNQYTLGADGAYGEVSSQKNAESLHGNAQINHAFVDDKWYDYGRGDALHDAIQDVEYRITAGAGAGYYIIKGKMTTLSSEAGPAFETEHLDDEYHNYPTARVAENFEHRIDGHVRLWENVEVLPPLTAPDAVLVNAEVGVETPLSPKMSLQTYLQDNFANTPAPGYKNNDLKVVSGVVFKF
jgi:putative salt-induced outer membrane protein YdiY